MRNTQSPPSRWRQGLAILAATGLVSFALGSSAQAQVSLTSSFTFNMGTGLFTYSYGVTNNGTLDLAIVDLNVGSNTQIGNLTAPAGFLAVYDPGLNLVSFLEDNDIFTAPTFAPSTTVAPFTFTSSVAPRLATFEALNGVGVSSVGTAQSPVPEPTTILWGAALSACALLKRNRRALATPAA